MDTTPDSGQAHPVMDYSATYTVVLRGEAFELTHDQLIRDVPNFFTGCFLNDFRESEARVVRLSRNPALFRILVEYLSGYQVLPLKPASLPPTMTMDVALQNLLLDCEFYGLEGLIPQIKKVLALNEPRPYAHIHTHGYYPGPPVDIGAVVRGQLPHGAEQQVQRGLCMKKQDGLLAPVTIEAKNVILQMQFSWDLEGSSDPPASIRYTLQFRDDQDIVKKWAADFGMAVTFREEDIWLGLEADWDASISINGSLTTFQKLRHWAGNMQTNLLRKPSLDMKAPEFDVFNKNLPIVPFDPAEHSTWTPEFGVTEIVTLHVDRLMMTIEQPATQMPPTKGTILSVRTTTIPRVYDEMISRAVYEDSVIAI